MIYFNNKHYITMNKYEDGGLKTNMGRFYVYLYGTERLPVHTTDDKPEPMQ
jgi:hypothetical protein